jgi:hypothetical protein
MKNSKFELRNSKDLARESRAMQAPNPVHAIPREPPFTPFEILISNFEFTPSPC